VPSTNTGRGGVITVAASANAPVTVNITRVDAVSLTVYTDAGLATSVSMPDAITSTKTYYLGPETSYSVSILFSGVEVNGPTTYTLDSSKNVNIQPNIPNLSIPQFDIGGVTTSLVSTTQKTTSYTLAFAAATPAASDLGKNIEMNSASATVVTVPTDAVAPFPIGTQVSIFRVGVGGVTITPSSGVTLNYGSPTAAVTCSIKAQWQGLTLLKRAANTWAAIGSLT